MSRTSTYASEEGLARDPDSPKPEEIRAQLRVVLADPTFHGSRRCQQFLEYVCEKSLAGDAGALKERAIAIEVFGRSPASAGQGEDTIVRVGAREVRKRLAQYYVTPEGAAAAIVIDLTPGSYVPEFRYASHQRPATAVAANPFQPAPASYAPAQAGTEESSSAAGSRKAILIGVLAAAALAAAGLAAAAAWPRADRRSTAFQHFWAPVFQSSGPLLVGVGHPIVYQPSHRAAVLNQRRAPATPFPVQRPIDLPPKELDGSDMIPVQNQFVGFGDMIAANEVTQMLARNSHAVRLLLASSIPFADLRQSQSYLIGSLSNRWTMELSQNWRFQFAWTPEIVPVIRDTKDAGHRQWSIPSKDDGSTPEDYSLICRIRNSPTGGLLIVSAGIKQFGTEAAGRILADPVELGNILNKLPAGWEDRNLQIVLHMKVIGNTPAQPEVVASWVW